MSSKAEAVDAPSTGPGLPGPLVDPSWLEDRLRHPRLRIVDLRDPDAYSMGHIPGAVHLDLAALGSSAQGLDNILLHPRDFGELMSDRGISNADLVVAYDDQWGLAATRLVWALHHYGHADAAAVNGGWDRWQDEGRSTATGEESAHSEGFEVAPRDDLHADTEWIVGRIAAGDAVLLDTRTPAEFDQGHLPGAVSWDWFNAVPAGSWNTSREPEELHEEWRALGLDPSDEVTVYCNSGMRASHTYVVLRNAGFMRVRVYDGSWQEWSMTTEGADGR